MLKYIRWFPKFLPLVTAKIPSVADALHYGQKSLIIKAVTDSALKGDIMKIKYIIGDKYTEPEVHLCVREKNREAEALYEAVETLLELRIVGYKGQESEFLLPAEIVRIYSENKKVFARTAEGCYEVKDRLYMLEEQLREQKFVRISNSELVNVQQIEKFDMSYAGTIQVRMKNGDVTYVSRRFVRKIKEVLC